MFSERLKALRKGRGMTQAQFAKDFNISHGTIGMWETGRREPDFDTVVQIATYFNVSTDYLLGRDEKEKPAPEVGSGLNEKDVRLIAWFHSLPQETRKAILTLGGAPEGLAE